MSEINQNPCAPPPIRWKDFKFILFTNCGERCSSYQYGAWWRWHRFPLLPQLHIRYGDDYNSHSFSFDWLFFHVWDAMSPDIGINIQLDDQCFKIQAHLPYLHLLFKVPLFPSRWSQKTWRIRSRRWF